MVEEIANITWVETGSDLIALIRETTDIKHYKPKFNHPTSGNLFKFGILKDKNKQGYIEIKVVKVKKHDRPVVMYESIVDAELSVYRRIQNFDLCPKLCGKDEKKKGSCDNYKINRCQGACIGEEDPREYNMRVEDSLDVYKYPFTNFMVIGEGREFGEESVVMVVNEQFKGYGYFPEGIKDPEKLKEYIYESQENSFDVSQIIRSFIKKNKLDVVIEF